MKSKKINKIIITVSCVIGIVIIGIVLYMVINNNSYKSLDLKYESTSKYTITSGSTGNVYDISKEECNNIIEKLNDTKVKQKNFEPTQGWSSYITFSDENGVSHKLEVKCINSCFIPPKIINGRYISVKKDTDKKHGYGMKSIQNIVGKYNGSHFEQFDEQENEFTISIMLMK